MKDEPLGYTYHSHTKRCGHAVGEDEDYVKKAIEGHYQILGFSDHVMLPYDSQHGMRGDFSLEPGYFKSVRDLQGKYQKQLQIYLAFEAEWYGDRYASYYHDLLAKKEVDYLLLGQHCFYDGNTIVFYAHLFDKNEATRLYTKDLIAGMRSGDFIYVAHPDLFMIWNQGWNSVCEECAHQIIETAKELHLTLEVNMGPSRWGRHNRIGEEIDVAYPYPKFWDLVGQSGVPVIIGVDDHDPNELLHSPFDWARDFVKKRSLNYVDRLALPFAYKPTK
jgi:histidinol-phosphatase (PHP family)